MSEDKIYDLIILGGGPAGITAAIYASRGMLDCTILDTTTIGGQLNYTQDIENYPGFPSIKGYELIQKFQEQLQKLNVDIKQFQELKEVNLKDTIKTITTVDKTYKAKTVILCTGASPRKLGIKGEKELIGMGVSYCAVCDGAFFKEKDIAVVGGGNSAIEEALYLTRFAKKVYIIHRRDALRASKVYQKRLFENPKIKMIWDSVAEEIEGDIKGVNNLKIKNLKTNEISDLKVNGIFPYIGADPNTKLFKDQVNMDNRGYLICEENMYAGTPGVYGAGDVRLTPLRQIIVSGADGAIAATSAIKYLDEVFDEKTVSV